MMNTEVLRAYIAFVKAKITSVDIEIPSRKPNHDLAKVDYNLVCQVVDVKSLRLDSIVILFVHI